MMPCIEKIQIFGGMNLYEPYQILRNHNPNEAYQMIYRL